MEARLIDIADSKVIELLNERGSIFIQPGWLNLYDDNYRLIGIFDKGEQLIGAFSYYVKTVLGQPYFLNAPFSPHIGLFFIDTTTNPANKNSLLKKVNQAVANYLLRQRHLFCSIGFPPSIYDVQSYMWSGFRATPSYTYKIDLTQDMNTILGNFSSTKRNDIKKAEKDGLKVELNQNSEIIEQLVIMTLGRKNKDIDVDLMRRILVDFGHEKNSYSFVAYLNGRPSACVFVVYDRSTAHYLLGGYDPKNKHGGAGAYALVHAIQHAMELGILEFDLEGSMLPEVEKNFRGFGGIMTPFFFVHHASYPVEVFLKLVKKAWY